MPRNYQIIMFMCKYVRNCDVVKQKIGCEAEMD